MPPYRFLFVFLLACASHALAQPLLSHMEEGDKIQLRLWIEGCFQLEDNAYEFEMKDGKILCTGWILPDYVTPKRHPRVQVEPQELTSEQIKGLDLDIVDFRRTRLREHRKAGTGVTVITRNSGESSTTTSELKLTFIEKGKTIIEETIICPDLSVLYDAPNKGLADLKRLLQSQVRPQLDLIVKKLTENRTPSAEPASSNEETGR